ncbi:MAG: DNA-3-methyladenine glycosylase I [Planctomycetes bacterium]|nr:DNA-3-methyladenine glycosylase I [Planctomycetota bacterium]
MNDPKDELHTDAHGVTRCWWCVGDPLYEAYHDTEWGFPAVGDNRLYENICLDGFQAGLSWLTILRKRERFRAAFAGFDIERVARFNKRTVDRLLRDAGIIRHRGKIEAAINNARRAIELIEEFGSLAAYVWRYEPSPRARTKAVTRATMPATSAESVAMSKDLKRRGWSFVGPTTLYAFMQAMGLVDDHLIGCDVRPRVESARQAFVRPASR